MSEVVFFSTMTERMQKQLKFYENSNDALFGIQADGMPNKLQISIQFCDALRTMLAMQKSATKIYVQIVFLQGSLYIICHSDARIKQTITDAWYLEDSFAKTHKNIYGFTRDQHWASFNVDSHLLCRSTDGLQAVNEHETCSFHSFVRIACEDLPSVVVEDSFVFAHHFVWPVLSPDDHQDIMIKYLEEDEKKLISIGPWDCLEGPRLIAKPLGSLVEPVGFLVQTDRSCFPMSVLVDTSDVVHSPSFKHKTIVFEKGFSWSAQTNFCAFKMIEKKMRSAVASPERSLWGSHENSEDEIVIEEEPLEYPEYTWTLPLSIPTTLPYANDRKLSLAREKLVKMPLFLRLVKAQECAKRVSDGPISWTSKLLKRVTLWSRVVAHALASIELQFGSVYSWPLWSVGIFQDQTQDLAPKTLVSAAMLATTLDPSRNQFQTECLQPVKSLTDAGPLVSLGKIIQNRETIMIVSLNVKHPSVEDDYTSQQLVKFVYELLLGLANCLSEAFRLDVIRVLQVLQQNVLQDTLLKGLEDIQSFTEPVCMSPTVEANEIFDELANDIGASLLYQSKDPFEELYEDLPSAPVDFGISTHLSNPDTILGKRKQTSANTDHKMKRTKTDVLYRNNGERVHARAWYKIRMQELLPKQMDPEIEYSLDPTSKYQKVLKKLRSAMRGSRFGKPRDPSGELFQEPRNVNDKILHILRDFKELGVVSKSFDVQLVPDTYGNVELQVVSDGTQILTTEDLSAAFVEFYGVTNEERT
jgi:hypothetical protein